MSAGGEEMSKFRKKPVVIEANQWFKNGDHPQDYANDVMGFDELLYIGRDDVLPERTVSTQHRNRCIHLVVLSAKRMDGRVNWYVIFVAQISVVKLGAVTAD